MNKPYKPSTMLLLAVFLLVGFVSGYLLHNIFDMFTDAHVVVSPLPIATAAPMAAPEPTIRIRVTSSSVPNQPTFNRHSINIFSPPFVGSLPIAWQYQIGEEEPMLFRIRGNTLLSASGLARIGLYSHDPFTLNGHASEEVLGFYYLDYHVIEKCITVSLEGQSIAVVVIPTDNTTITVR